MMTHKSIELLLELSNDEGHGIDNLILEYNEEHKKYVIGFKYLQEERLKPTYHIFEDLTTKETTFLGAAEILKECCYQILMEDNLAFTCNITDEIKDLCDKEAHNVIMKSINEKIINLDDWDIKAEISFFELHFTGTHKEHGIVVKDFQTYADGASLYKVAKNKVALYELYEQIYFLLNK